MRILILNQFFYPDHSATSQLMTDLAEGLVDRGFQVTAISSRGRYNGGEKLPGKETHHGVRIERAWATNFGKANIAGRLCDYLSFYIGAAFKLLFAPKHDIVMALTTPPLIGLVAVAIGRLRGMQVVALMQDVYPDVAIALGALRRRSLLSRTLGWLTRQMLKGSTRIIVLGECMKDRIVEIIGPERLSRIDVIHNWADGATIKPIDEKESSFAARNRIGNAFVVMFSGNLGQVNDFETLMESASLLKNRPDIQFVFIGEGAKKTYIAEYARINNLTNVRLLPYQPQEDLRVSLAAGHASVVTLADGLAGLSVPSKSYGIMAAGRPILFVGDRRSSIAALVQTHDCGEVIDCGDAARVAQVIESWAHNRRHADKLGLNGRAAFEKYFDRPIAIESYVQCFLRCGVSGVKSWDIGEPAASSVPSPSSESLV